jgi:hypothetical protein
MDDEISGLSIGMPSTLLSKLSGASNSSIGLVFVSADNSAISIYAQNDNHR